MFVYIAQSTLNPNKPLIKIGTANNIDERQKRFDNAPHNKGMTIQKAIYIKDCSRAFAWLVEARIRYDLSQYNTHHTTMDTFTYNPKQFYATAYINAFERKVNKAINQMRGTL